MSGRLGRQQAAVHRGWNARDFRRALFRRPGRITKIVVVSVADRRLERHFAAAARAATHLAPTFVATVRRAGGVTTRYAEPWRLGVDRFVAVIGANAMARGRPVCVIDVGTAMTIDLLDARGVHRGGAIIPGPELMIESLLRQTTGIARRARAGGRGSSLFARDTAAAVGQGARFAAAAAIDRAIAEARRELGARPRVFLTGGAAAGVRALIRAPNILVPDLVLRGLAVLA